MRFIHIEDFFHPNAGYQLNLLGKLQVKQGHEVIILTSEIEKTPDHLKHFFGSKNIIKLDEEYFKKNGVKIIRLPVFGWYSGRAIFKGGLFKKIKSLKPDVLFLHGESTLTSIRVLLSYKRFNMPMVIDSHMLDMASSNKLKYYFRMFFKKFITPIILKNKIPIIRVVNSDFLQRHFGLPLEKTILLSFGTDIDFFSPNQQTKKHYRKSLGIQSTDFIVTYAGKLDEAKGGLFLAESIKNKINIKGLKFLIIGNTADDDYGYKVEDTFLNSKNHIVRYPTQSYSDINKFYQISDIAIFPKQCSMSYFEVQSCGLPVILEENEINIQRVSNSKGILFKPNSKDSLIDAIYKFAMMSKKEIDIYRQNSRDNIITNYNYEKVAKSFTRIMIQSHKKFSETHDP